MGDDERKGPHGKNDQHFFPIMRYGAGTLMGNRRDELLVCSPMTFAAGFEFVLAEHRGLRIVLRPDVMRIVAACADRGARMSEMKFPSVEAFLEAVHNVFLKLIFLDDFLTAVTLAAGLYLIFAAHGRLAVFGFGDIMRRTMTVQAECAVHLFFLCDVLSMHTGQNLLIDLSVTLCAGSAGNRVTREFCRYF